MYPYMQRCATSTVSSIYPHIAKAVALKTISPPEASNLIAKAIMNGHAPPEVCPVSIQSWAYLVKSYVGREMYSLALAEINVCLDRGRVDKSRLLAHVADAYIDCLISTGVQRHRHQLIQAARFVASLHRRGLAMLVSDAVYDRLIDKLNRLPTKFGAIRVVSIALQNNVNLNTASWNVRLHEAVRISPDRALWTFRAMSNAGVSPDRWSITMLLACLRQDKTFTDQSLRLLDIAKKLGIYTEAVVTEEMALLKRDEQYKDVLTLFSHAFGSDALGQLGVQSSSGSDDSGAKRAFTLTPQALSLAIDALVRLNPHPESIEQIYSAYLDIIAGKSEFVGDVYSPSILIGAFAQHKETLERAMQILEEMRVSEAEPTVVSYTSMIDGLIKNGMIDLATRVIQYMRQADVEPNEYTWNLMHRGYKSVGDLTGMGLAEEMIKETKIEKPVDNQIYDFEEEQNEFVGTLSY